MKMREKKGLEDNGSSGPEMSDLKKEGDFSEKLHVVGKKMSGMVAKFAKRYWPILAFCGGIATLQSSCGRVACTPFEEAQCKSVITTVGAQYDGCKIAYSEIMGSEKASCKMTGVGEVDPKEMLPCENKKLEKICSDHAAKCYQFKTVYTRDGINLELCFALEDRSSSENKKEPDREEKVFIPEPIIIREGNLESDEGEKFPDQNEGREEVLTEDGGVQEFVLKKDGGPDGVRREENFVADILPIPDEPRIADEPVKPDKSQKPDEPAGADKSMGADETLNRDEPNFVEKPPISEEPRQADEPPKSDELFGRDEIIVADDSSSADKETITEEKAGADEAPSPEKLREIAPEEKNYSEELNVIENLPTESSAEKGPDNASVPLCRAAATGDSVIEWEQQGNVETEDPDLRVCRSGPVAEVCNDPIIKSGTVSVVHIRIEQAICDRFASPGAKGEIKAWIGNGRNLMIRMAFVDSQAEFSFAGFERALGIRNLAGNPQEITNTALPITVSTVRYVYPTGKYKGFIGIWPTTNIGCNLTPQEIQNGADSCIISALFIAK